MPNKCPFLRTPSRTVPSVTAHSGFSYKQLPAEPVGHEDADGIPHLLNRPCSNIEPWSNTNSKGYSKNQPRRDVTVPWFPHSSFPHLPRRNSWLTMKPLAKELQIFH